MPSGGTEFKDIPVYVINLPERKDRWKRFLMQEGIKQFTHMNHANAFNGRKMNFRKDPRISIQTRLRIYRNYRRSHYEIATLGAIGATVSHTNVWKRFLESGKDECIVMEDDAMWSVEDVVHAAELYKTLPQTYGMWIIGFRPHDQVIERMEPPNTPWNRVYNFTAAHSYLLTRDAAKILLEEPFPVESHVEYYITACSILKNFLIVHHPDIHIPYFQTIVGKKTRDSNTSQHKKKGCPTCNTPDDYSQLYKHYTRRSKNGMVVSDVAYGKQSDTILTFNSKSPATRKVRRVSGSKKE
jgi:GR25 family glycosyltransferase involved in LPS biosynthesis